MGLNDLILTLRDQHENLQYFLETVIKHQKAIINGDLLGMEHALVAQEHLLHKIDAVEKKKNTLVAELAKKISANSNIYKLSELINILKSMKNVNTDILNRFQDSIKKLIENINIVNGQNRVLVEHSRSFIRETISALVNTNNSPILDRKI